MGAFKKFLERITFSTPFDEKDLKEAYLLGVKTTVEYLRNKQKGMVVNGTCQSVILDDQLNFNPEEIL